MAKLTQEERIKKALAQRAQIEEKIKKLQEQDRKKSLDRLESIAKATGLLDVPDENLIPDLKALVERLKTGLPTT
ncbi:hypothetical protein [Paraburkholderia phenazinium]|uniref:hypothetical protein n=1 Tax=Paraburkholderia phenazinium TaxID=60549 RepID=UPI001588F7BA|nr:hypothetical protein [Paraburkholderia phenazinium]